MTRPATRFVAATAMTMLLLLLLGGCAGAGQQQKADQGDRSDQQQKTDRSDSGGQQVDARQEEKTVSVVPCQPIIVKTEEDPGKIVFQLLGSDSTLAPVYTMNANGSDLSQFTHSTTGTANFQANPTWSPGLQKVAFVVVSEEIAESASEDYGSASPKIYIPSIVVMNADGSNPRKLLNSPAWEPAWSPDGKYIAFVSEGDYDIYVMNANGSGTPKKITSPLDYGIEIGELSVPNIDLEWSPDCKKLAFVVDGVIYVVNVSSEEGKTNQPQLLTDNARQPSWSPNGTEIAFTRGDPEYPGTPSHVYKVDADGSKETRLTHFAQGKELWPTWSPDGKKIAFVRTGYPGVSDPGSTAVFVMDSDGSDAILLRKFPGGSVRYPEWRAAQHGKRAE